MRPLLDGLRKNHSLLAIYPPTAEINRALLVNQTICAWKEHRRIYYDEKILNFIRAMHVRNNDAMKYITDRLPWELTDFIIEQFLIELKQR